MLIAAPPTLAYEGRETGVAALEQPIDVLVGPVSLDEEPLGPERLATFAYFVYRRQAPGADLDTWDDATASWSPEPDTSTSRVPIQLAYQPDDPQPWRGIIVGAGGKPSFDKAAGGYPLYSVRAFFVTTDSSEAFLTGPSENFAFVAGGDRNLLVMGPGEDEELHSATETRVLLRDTSLQTIGRLHIERAFPGAAVALDNAAGASIVLHPDGRIEITPAPGEPVIVKGDLEAEHITYLPANSNVKKTLT